MAIFSKQLLSESTNGLGILITSTSTPGTYIHTSASGTSDLDEIWLWATNSSDESVELTIEWGQTDAPDGNIIGTLSPASGLFTIIPGLLLQNSKIVSAFASSGSAIIIHGFVNRITS